MIAVILDNANGSGKTDIGTCTGKRAFPYRGIDTGGSRGRIGPAVKVGGDIGGRKRSSGDEAARVEGFGSRYHPSGRMSGRQGSNRRGELVLMSASLCPFSESLAMSLNRREFLVAGGAVALTALSAGSLEGAPDTRKNQRVSIGIACADDARRAPQKRSARTCGFRTTEAAKPIPSRTWASTDVWSKSSCRVPSISICSRLATTLMWPTAGISNTSRSSDSG